ncbi:MAG TPA: preprotein translocase subunit SecG [bacterium]|nr:preprotein translocase subunit SecG [bacterium]
MNAFLYGLVVALHVAICLILVVVVLLQQGKGDGNLGGLAGGSSNTVFGSRGPTTFFHYLTTGSAVIFIFTSLFLSCTPSPSNKTGSVISDATPAPTAAMGLGTAGGAAPTEGGMAPIVPPPASSPAAPAATPASSPAK